MPGALDVPAVSWITVGRDGAMRSWAWEEGQDVDKTPRSSTALTKQSRLSLRACLTTGLGTSPVWIGRRQERAHGRGIPPSASF